MQESIDGSCEYALTSESDMARASWTGERIGKLSILVSLFVAYYILGLQASPGEMWLAYVFAPVAFLMAMLSVYLLFKGDGWAHFIDWLTGSSGDKG